jgi:hypothetical protein
MYPVCQWYYGFGYRKLSSYCLELFFWNIVEITTVPLEMFQLKNILK